jgi:glycine cleavage system transcriptional repressor
MENSYAVLTAVGPDRVGIVDDISGIVAERKCNIEDSRMAVLGGEFAVIMLVSGGQDAVRALTAALPGRGDALGLRIECRATRAPGGKEEGRPYLLEVVSLDTPGIVHAITAVLRKSGVNIESLETDTGAAPWTGAPMFRMKAHIVVESGLRVGDLRDMLARLQNDRDLDIVLKPVFPAAGDEE